MGLLVIIAAHVRNINKNPIISDMKKLIITKKRSMKKGIVIILSVIIFHCAGFAQVNDIEGVWQMYQMEFAGEPHEVNMAITFAEEGKIIMGSKEKGTWQFDQAKKILTISSDFLMSLDGECSFSLNDKEMTLVHSEEGTSKLRRLSLPNNQEYTNLVLGKWKLTKMNGNNYEGSREIILDYNKNGIFYQGGVVMGFWEYNKKANKIIQKALRKDSKEMNGQAKIVTLDKEKMVYELNGMKTTFQKVIED